MEFGSRVPALLAALPTNPVRQFQLCYCTWLTLVMCLNIRHHTRFYRWFYSSGISLAEKRGLGAHPSKIYKMITPPTLTPSQLPVAGAAFTACLALSCTPLAPRVFLFIGFLLYFLYFPQLFAETTLSGHSSILIPSILLLLSCSPSLDHEVGLWKGDTTVWPLQLIRLYIGSGYFSSGMCKLLCGIRFKRFWGRGSTLQYYVFEGMWSRPAPPLIKSLQWFLLKSPMLMTGKACTALVFETGFIFAVFNDNIALVFGIAGFFFHGGILVLQGLDFVSYWSPALLAFVIPLGQPTSELLRAGWEQENSWFLPAAIYTALQVLVAVSLYDLWLDDILPFSCCPMFMPPRSPYDKLPKWWTMTDAPLNGTTRAAGAMEPLYWSPASCIFKMSLDEAGLLPQKVVWFGSSTGCPPEVRDKFIDAECRDRPFMVFANFEFSAELKDLLHRVMDEVNNNPPSRAWDAHKMHELLTLQQQCLDAFNLCAAAARARDSPKPIANGSAASELRQCKRE